MIKERIDMNRFKWELDNIAKKPTCDHCTLFYGSSTFAHYVKIEDDFKEYNARNAGFGGSTSHEALYHYDYIVKRFNPDTLVWYFGDNEPVCGYTFKETIELFKAVFDKYHQDYPDGHIIILGTKSSYARKEYYKYVVKLNKWEKEYALNHYYIDYVDVSDVWYKDNDYNYDNFLDDKLHYNDKGNSILCERIKKVIDSHKTLDIKDEPNVEETLNQIKSVRTIAVVTTGLVLAATLLGLFLSQHHNYIRILIVDIIVTCVYIFFIVYLLREILYHLKKLYKLYVSMRNADLDKHKLTYVGCENEYNYNEVVVKKLIFNDSKKNEIDVYNLYDNNIYLTKNKKYKIETLNNVLVKVEEVND